MNGTRDDHIKSDKYMTSITHGIWGKKMIQLNLFTKQKQRTKKQISLPKGMRGEEINEKFGINRYTLLINR